MHTTANTTKAAHEAEIAAVIEAGADGPRFCNQPYVGLAACERATGHDGEHVTTGLTGRLIGY